MSMGDQSVTFFLFQDWGRQTWGLWKSGLEDTRHTWGKEPESLTHWLKKKSYRQIKNTYLKFKCVRISFYPLKPVKVLEFIIIVINRRAISWFPSILWIWMTAATCSPRFFYHGATRCFCVIFNLSKQQGVWWWCLVKCFSFTHCLLRTYEI